MCSSSIEIEADDVKASHGATIGSVDEAALFYLRARGIDAELARSLLIYGFVNDLIGEIELPELRERVGQLVLDRLPQGEDIKELA